MACTASAARERNAGNSLCSWRRKGPSTCPVTGSWGSLLRASGRPTPMRRRSQDVYQHEADIVTVIGILRARIAKPCDQPGGCIHVEESGLLLLFGGGLSALVAASGLGTLSGSRLGVWRRGLARRCCRALNG